MGDCGRWWEMVGDGGRWREMVGGDLLVVSLGGPVERGHEHQEEGDVDDPHGGDLGEVGSGDAPIYGRWTDACT